MMIITTIIVITLVINNSCDNNFDFKKNYFIYFNFKKLNFMIP